MKRAPWHEYFMLLAKMVALRSGCNSRPSGAVIVRDKRILATGYNGPMPGAWHCIDKGPGYCFRREKGIPDIDKYNFCRATHAEANAIAQAARFGISVEGADLYCTLAPCYVCLKLIASAGIKAVYYEYDYGSRDFQRDAFWREAIKEAGLKEFRQIKVSPEVLTQLQEIISYPTSKRRLPPTEFLESFEDNSSYILPTVEVLQNKLRYQTNKILKDIKFTIEKITKKRPEEQSIILILEDQKEYTGNISEYILKTLLNKSKVKFKVKIDQKTVKITINIEDQIEISAEIENIDLKNLDLLLTWLNYIGYEVSQEFSKPVSISLAIRELILENQNK